MRAVSITAKCGLVISGLTPQPRFSWSAGRTTRFSSDSSDLKSAVMRPRSTLRPPMRASKSVTTPLPPAPRPEPPSGRLRVGNQLEAERRDVA